MTKRNLGAAITILGIVLVLWNVGPTVSAKPVQPEIASKETTVSHREVFKLSSGSYVETSTVIHTHFSGQ